MSLARPTLRLSPASTSRLASTYARTVAPWPSKTHIKKKASIPNPLPAIYPQRVVLSDGSTFTSYTTAPVPATLRLTRDLTNNPLWAPGTMRGGISGDTEEGRVGRFRRRFEGTGSADAKGGADVFGNDLSWISGGEEEKITARQRAGPVKTKKGKK